MNNKANDTYSLSHTSWKCQYHIVFAPKYRRKEIYGKLKKEIWCKGYYVSTVGGNKEGIARYIREQEHEDQIYDQIALKEYTDPFKN